MFKNILKLSFILLSAILIGASDLYAAGTEGEETLRAFPTAATPTTAFPTIRTMVGEGDDATTVDDGSVATSTRSDRSLRGRTFSEGSVVLTDVGEKKKTRVSKPEGLTRLNLRHLRADSPVAPIEGFDEWEDEDFIRRISELERDNADLRRRLIAAKEDKAASIEDTERRLERLGENNMELVGEIKILRRKLRDYREGRAPIPSVMRDSSAPSMLSTVAED